MLAAIPVSVDHNASTERSSSKFQDIKKTNSLFRLCFLDVYRSKKEKKNCKYINTT